MRSTLIIILTSIIFLSGCSSIGVKDTNADNISKSKYYPLRDANSAGNEAKFRVISNRKGEKTDWLIETIYRSETESWLRIRQLTFNIDSREFAFYAQDKVTRRADSNGVKEIATFNVSEELILALSNDQVIQTKLSGWEKENSEDNNANSTPLNDKVDSFDYTLKNNEILDIKKFIKQLNNKS